MALLPMYPGKVNSPQTELASAIDDEQTTIPLLDASVLPDPPNLATIGTGEDAETILYTGVSGNDLTGVTRGFQGAAKAWSAGQKVARNFTAYDYDALRQNLESHGSEHNHDGADPIPDLVQLRELGLGIDVDPRTTENLDLEVQPGWVVTTPETIGIPPYRGHGVVRIDRRRENRVAQTYYHLSGAMELAVYSRVLGGTGWTDWDKAIYRSDFERGANENGEYIIFPSGFAVCFRRLQIDFSNTNVQSVDMPIAFASRSLLYTGWNLSHSHSAPNIRDRGLIFDYAAGTVAAWRFVVSGYSTHADTASVTLYAAGFTS